jgi:hypothetical protein
MPRSRSIFIQSERAAAVAARLHRARELDGAAEQQQLFGQRRLAGVGMRDDRERAPAVEADRGGRAPELIGERGGPRLQLHAQRLQRAEEIEDEKLGIEHVVGSVVGVRPSATDAHGP